LKDNKGNRNKNNENIGDLPVKRNMNKLRRNWKTGRWWKYILHAFASV